MLGAGPKTSSAASRAGGLPVGFHQEWNGRLPTRAWRVSLEWLMVGRGRAETGMTGRGLVSRPAKARISRAWSV